MLGKTLTNFAPAAALALGALTAGWSAPAEANSFTVRISGYVPTRCSGSLVVTGGSDLVKLGAISTNCNTAFSMTMHYPAELGPMQVAYNGRICTGQNGEVRLTDRSPPSIGVAPVQISAQNGALNAAPFYVVLAPQGL
ncbi:MAG TPA: hypothetical protein PKY87_00885 [Terricaulis sp.]|nr:hypothetical protein [Terricaulis sp.]